MFSLMIHGGHDGSDHCRKNAGYSSFLQCHHLHIQHESVSMNLMIAILLIKLRKKHALIQEKGRLLCIQMGLKQLCFIASLKSAALQGITRGGSIYM